MDDHSWVQLHSYQPLPQNAVYAGQDTDGDPIYVGRASHAGDHIPCKLIPNKQAAFIAYDGQEIPKNSFEVLCGTDFTWVPSSGGSVVQNALVGGRTINGEPLYIGRAHYAGSLTPGKIHTSHGCLYFSYGGKEISMRQYEVLVSNPRTWIRCQIGGPLPPNLVHAGQDSDGHVIYVGRAYHQGDQIPAKVIPSKRAAYISYNGEEISVHEYELLCGHGYTWVGSANGHVPAGAVPAGKTLGGETLYIGRGHCEGSLTPGKVHPSHFCLYIPYGGTERKLNQYEVLVKPY